ncbi:MAG: PAS domain S-box protein [Bacteroidota bacterium]|nr:PAS domain S-box protein [Bacteroidota bacterium]
MDEFERFFKTFINSTPDMVFVKDENLNIKMVNKSYLDFIERTENETLGKNDFELLPFELAQVCRESDLKSLNTCKLIRTEEKVSDNKIYEVIKYPVFLGEGRIGLGAFIKDITETKINEEKIKEINKNLDSLVQSRTEELMKTNFKLKVEIEERKEAQENAIKSELKFKLAFKLNHNLMAISTADDGIIVDVSDSYLEKLGYTREEVIGVRAIEIFRNNRREELVAQIKGKGQIVNYELDVWTKNGEIMSGLYSGNIIESNGVKYLLTSFIDITDRKKLEAALSVSEQSFRNIFNNIHDAVFIHNIDGTIIDFNDKVLEMFKISEEDAGHLSILEDYSSKENRFKIIEGVWKLVYSGKNQLLEWKVKRPLDKHEFWTEMFIRKVNYRNRDAILTTVRDISERKQAEEKIKTALEKEKEINLLKTRFISTVSHEFRTPLAGISSNLHLLERYYEKMDYKKKERCFERINISVKNITFMIDEIALMSKDHSGKLDFNPMLTNIEKYCEEIVTDTFTNYSIDIEIKISINSNIGEILIDRNLFKQILVNLLSNAIKYSLESNLIEFELNETNDNQLLIVIKDYGLGITKEDMNHIFEPFHRGVNVEAIQGTGLGMSIVKRGVDMHNGTIEINSEVNKGTIVKVYIPIRK